MRGKIFILMSIRMAILEIEVCAWGIRRGHTIHSRSIIEIPSIGGRLNRKKFTL